MGHSIRDLQSDAWVRECLKPDVSMDSLRQFARKRTDSEGLRDIRPLVEQGVLVRNPEGGGVRVMLWPYLASAVSIHVSDSTEFVSKRGGPVCQAGEDCRKRLHPTQHLN